MMLLNCDCFLKLQEQYYINTNPNYKKTSFPRDNNMKNPASILLDTLNLISSTSNNQASNQFEEYVKYKLSLTLLVPM